MKKQFICYLDMDGVINLFESDPHARDNMWRPGYFANIPAREGIDEVMFKINQQASVVILSKIIDRIGVTKEKGIFLRQNISQDAYDDIIYVPYDKSKSEYIKTYFQSMLVDDNEKNLDECERKGCMGLFLSDVKKSLRYPNAYSPEDIYQFFLKVTQNI